MKLHNLFTFQFILGTSLTNQQHWSWNSPLRQLC